jgi:LPS-assembly lipoprotein
MSWPEDLAFPRCLLRSGLALAIAATAAGCFQPMYAQRPIGGAPNLSEALAAVDVQQIDAPGGTALSRIAVETRNELLFGITGGSGSAPPTHKLKIRLVPSNAAVILDVFTNRPEFENFGLDANYTLTDIATGKNVLSASAAARVTYTIPGQQQRFARGRGQRDAESRAAKLIAEQIKSRLASYFVAGT